MKRSVALLFAGTIAATATTALADEPEPTPPPDPKQILQSGATGETAPPPEGVAASDLAPPAKKPEEPTEVRVIGSRADALQRVAGSGTVIGAKDLKRAAPVDTAEMLRRVPGVQVRQEYSGGSRLDISIRGLESGRSRRVLLLEDGIPMSLNPYSEPDMNHAPFIERYQAIEVVKGSGNILFGPQTLAGTINFVTIAPPEHRDVVADVDVGTYGYARALARYGDTLGNARYVVQIIDRRGDGFRAQPFDSQNGLAKVIVPTGENGEAMIRLGFQHDDAASDDIGLTSAMWRDTPRRTTLAPADHLYLNRYDAALIHTQRFSDSTTLKTLVYGYTTGRTWRRQDYTRVPAVGQDYTRIVGDTSVPNGAIYFKDSNVVLDRDYGVMGLEPRLTHRATTAGVGHTIDVGGRALHETAHYEQRAGSYAETYTGSLDFAEDHAGTAFAAYLQDRMAFTDKLLVTPGIRVEHLSFSRTVLRQNDGGVVKDVFEQGKKDVTGVIPGVGIVYGTKTANAFGGLHYGYAPPRVTSAISARGTTTDLKGDRSINYELGSRVTPTRWLRLEATGFLSNFSNQVTVGTGAGSDVGNLTDAGATNIYGVESGTLLAFDRMFRWATIVELGARYTYSHATFRYGPDAGNFLPYAPLHSFNTNFDVEHRSGFGGQIAYSFTARQFTDTTNTRQEDVTGIVGEIGERHIVDATAHYHHKPSGLTFRLSVKNLLDQTYIIARRPEGIFPGGYRQVIAGVRWEWDAGPRAEGGRPESGPGPKHD